MKGILFILIMALCSNPTEGNSTRKITIKEKAAKLGAFWTPLIVSNLLHVGVLRNVAKRVNLKRWPGIFAIGGVLFSSQVFMVPSSLIGGRWHSKIHAHYSSQANSTQDQVDNRVPKTEEVSSQA